MKFPFKQIFIYFVLASFLMMALFSFVVMIHGSEGQIPGNCPFSSTGVSLCPQDSLAVVIHHISAYQSLLSAPLNFSMTVFILFLIFAAGASLFISSGPPLIKLQTSAEIFYGPPAEVSPRDKNITRWLSLFENSPALR